MKKKEKAPEKKFIDISQNYRQILNSLDEFQKVTINLVKFAKLGQRNAEYKSREYSKYEEIASNHPEFKPYLDDLNRSADRELKQTRNIVISLARNFKMFENIAYSTDSASIDGAGTTFILNSGINHIQYFYPDSDIIKNYKLEKLNIDDYRVIEDELDVYLSKIEPELVKKRRGAWETINSVSSDKKAQAAHSMREILHYLISKWASNEDVKKAKWWEYVSDTRAGVSLKQRLKYLLTGSENELMREEELASIENKIKKIDAEFDFLKSVAHGSQKGTIEHVENIMRSVESTILHIIKIRERHHKDI